MKKLNKKGFTLLELLAVLVILAALATIAIPIFTNKGATARLAAHIENIRVINDAIQRYEWEKGKPDPTNDANLQEYYTFLDITAGHPLIKQGFLTSVPVSPYKDATGLGNYRYAIGINPTTKVTEAKLVTVHGGGVADGTDTTVGSTDDYAEIVQSTSNDGIWIDGDAIDEIPTTAAEGQDPTPAHINY